MTRALHQATRVQRGDPADFPKAAIARGYEASEAPPAKVALGLGAFVAVMFVGMGAAALVANVWSGAQPPRTAAAARDMQQPPPPRLLADPALERRRIEDAARRRLASAPVPIDTAMARVARQGWGDDIAAPPVPEAARDHAEAVR